MHSFNNPACPHLAIKLNDNIVAVKLGRSLHTVFLLNSV